MNSILIACRQLIAIFLLYTIIINNVCSATYTAQKLMGLQSALIGHRLYFFCGVTSKGTLIRDLFFLDLSSSFNIANPPYALASTYDSSEFPGCLYSTGVVGGSNNATIVVFGG